MSARLAAIVTLWVVVCWALASPVAPAAELGTISGTVTDSHGEPIRYANVIVEGIMLGAFTAPDGTYTFRDVPAGQYNVYARILGYATARHAGIRVEGQDTTVVDFKLNDLPSRPPEGPEGRIRPPVFAPGPTIPTAPAPANRPTSLRRGPPPSPVRVLVTRWALGSQVKYRYRVVNGGEYPISALMIGYDDTRVESEITVPPGGWDTVEPPESTYSAPRGWRFQFIPVEGESLGMLEWDVIDSARVILGGRSAAGFSATVSSPDTMYEHGHWTAYTTSTMERVYTGLIEPDSPAGAQQQAPLDRGKGTGITPARGDGAEDSLVSAVHEFVGKLYVHGVPYEQAHALGREALPVLQEILADSLETGNWATACATIGSIGEPEGFPILHGFVWQRFKGDVDETTLRALSSAQQCIGLLASNSPATIDYLSQGADPGFWTTLPWSSPRHTQEKLGLLFARLSISGLGYVDNPRARAELVRIRGQERLPILRREAEAALAASDSVEARGLPAYMKSLREHLGGP